MHNFPNLNAHTDALSLSPSFARALGLAVLLAHSHTHRCRHSAGLVHCAWKIFISWLVHMRAWNMKNCTNVQKMLQNYMTWGGKGGWKGEDAAWQPPKKRTKRTRTTKHWHIKYDNCGAKCYIWKVFLGCQPRVLFSISTQFLILFYGFSHFRAFEVVRKTNLRLGNIIYYLFYISIWQSR